MDKLEIKKLKVNQDERGMVVEIIRREDLKQNKPFGQVYLTTANPGFTKGNHYHKRKTEWFCVIKGKGELVLKDLISKETKRILMDDEENFVVVEIPPNVAHAIKNIGSEVLYLLAYIDEPYNPNDPDTFPAEVEF